jgi:hypothetical protein
VKKRLEQKVSPALLGVGLSPRRDRAGALPLPLNLVVGLYDHVFTAGLRGVGYVHYQPRFLTNAAS